MYRILKVCVILALLGSQAWSKEDKIFGGIQLGLGGVGDYDVGGIVGYMHYFPKKYYIADQFRQGVRGVFEVSYMQKSYNYWGGKYTYGSVYGVLGADYLLDFNPKDKFVYGIFAGLGLGYLNVFSKDWYASASAFGIDVRFGGSLTISQTHRFELALGSGYSLLGLRYMFLF
ncbi:MAG: hypothetical protein J1E28_03975 [Helicobacter sp.]|uniref:hypothetical protein n=1 Tax=Helicobacter sp. TaxID=218 RepID=UPI0025BD4D2C|nr:hypothetical protein [Helicobacter sp.]MCH5313542.1 hypothetical protein [Helicobacter sp.]